MTIPNLHLTAIQLGNSETPANNFLITVPDVADGTLTIKRGNDTVVATIDAAGKWAHPTNDTPTYISGWCAADSGALASASWVGYYTRSGNQITLSAKVTVADAGTGAGALVCVGVPAARSIGWRHIGVGRVIAGALAGAQLQAFIADGGNGVALLKYDNTAIITSASEFNFAISYIAA